MEEVPEADLCDIVGDVLVVLKSTADTGLGRRAGGIRLVVTVNKDFHPLGLR